MFSRLFVFISIIRELSCEWVELPKLEPWSVEPVRHFTAASPSVHLIQRDMVKVPEVQPIGEVADIKQHSGASFTGKEIVKVETDIEAATDAGKGYNISTTLRSEISRGSSNQTVISQGNASAFTNLHTLNQFMSSKPSLGDWDSVADHKSPNRDKGDLPGSSRPFRLPTASIYEERYPNRSYTYLDPLIESLMLKVHHTLLSHAGQPINQKIHFLQTLQNNIMNQIWKRSQRLWVIEGPEARASEMMSFPSLEGALLTISFLTFAVFLIRIVRQFIQGIQGTNTTMIDVTPTRVRHKRDLLASQTIEILRMMEEFHLQHS